jgi:hypothetical protein
MINAIAVMSDTIDEMMLMMVDANKNRDQHYTLFNMNMMNVDAEGEWDNNWVSEMTVLTYDRDDDHHYLNDGLIHEWMMI